MSPNTRRIDSRKLLMSMRVLVVDDEAPFVSALSRRLDKRGFTVVTASDGLEALERLQEDREIEVVLLDVKMPGMDGIEVLRAIKKEHPCVGVILLTGHASTESGMEGMKWGAFDYLMKPCDLAVLEERIQEARAKKSSLS
jgi:DNA-binding response OmpR family regulator